MEDSVEGNIAGQSFRFQGRESIYLLITALLAVFVGYMLWASTQQLSVDMASQHKVLKDSTDQLSEQMKVQNYISTLSTQKREALHLSMPRSLREGNSD